MKTLLRWKSLLPTMQLVFAIALWLYIPVQYRKELLQANHEPTEHPFRYRLPPSEAEGKVELFPPACQRLLYIINFPAHSVSRCVTDKLLYWIENRNQAGLPEWEFTLPVMDPEALVPRQVRYFVHVSDLIFLGLIAALWYWVGSWIDEYFDRRRGKYVPMQTSFHILELAVVAALILLSAIFSYRLITQVQSPQYRRVGVFGLGWPVLLLAYGWFAARRQLRQRSATE
jgi:hypothetical protein